MVEAAPETGVADPASPCVAAPPELVTPSPEPEVHMEGMTPETGQQEMEREKSLESTLKRFNEAFNRFDPAEVASFWADDGTLINPGGEYGKGRPGVAKVYGKDCETILDETTSKFTIVSTRRIGGDCVFLDIDHDIQNVRMPDGSTGP